MSKYRFVSPQNADLLVAIGARALRALDEALIKWDGETGIPARLVEYNAKHGVANPKETGQKLGAFFIGMYNANGRLAVTIGANKEEEGHADQPLLVVEPANTVNGAAVCFELALRYILKGYAYQGGHTVYLHGVESNGQAYPYYGITKRKWSVRWAEHLSASRAGSNLLFHRALREKLKPGAKIFHTICVTGVTEDMAMDVEEYLVGKRSLHPQHPNGLNMIPGGKAGVLWLHKLGALSRSTAGVEDRDRALAKWVLDNPRKGVPNPLVAQAWSNASYAEAVICGAPGRLSKDQVLEIRRAAGLDLNAIAVQVGARNVHQVSRVLRGETYARVAA